MRRIYSAETEYAVRLVACGFLVGVTLGAGLALVVVGLVR